MSYELTDEEIVKGYHEACDNCELHPHKCNIKTCMDSERTLAKAAQDKQRDYYLNMTDEKIEGIVEEIEAKYGKSFGSKQIFIGVIPSEDWQSLKDKCLK